MGCAPRNEGRILWATVAGPRQNHLLWALGWERFKIGITSWSLLHICSFCNTIPPQELG